MSREVELLEEIRNLLEVIAEPALEKRDARMREALRTIVGDGAKKAKAVLLMDGSRSQAAVAKESTIDSSNLSRLTKQLLEEKLIVVGAGCPRLLIKIPQDFFERGQK